MSHKNDEYKIKKKNLKKNVYVGVTYEDEFGNIVKTSKHRRTAELVLGRTLSSKNVVHHMDGNKSNNKKNNLVICESSAYHSLLHKRSRDYDKLKNLPLIKEKEEKKAIRTYEIKKICMNAFKYGMHESAKMNNISPGRVSQIIKKHKNLIFMDHELYDGNGDPRPFKHLRKIFNEPI